MWRVERGERIAGNASESFPAQMRSRVAARESARRIEWVSVGMTTSHTLNQAFSCKCRVAAVPCEGAALRHLSRCVHGRRRLTSRLVKSLVNSHRHIDAPMLKLTEAGA